MPYTYDPAYDTGDNALATTDPGGAGTDEGTDGGTAVTVTDAFHLALKAAFASDHATAATVWGALADAFAGLGTLHPADYHAAATFNAYLRAA